MTINKNNIFDNVISQDLCVGCGACLYGNSKSGVKMDWNKEGFLVPTAKSKEITISDDAIKVCPFNPYPAIEVRTEDELATIFLHNAPNFHPKAGRYFNTYAGYSEEFRLTSSSGGLATYILSELFEQKIIDAVITVGEGGGEDNHYEYKLIKKKEELLATSKTRYYPVTMADALHELENFDGKVAIVGVGSFIKAVRLLQYYNPELREKIVFTIGIICGGLKSKFFGEYLAAKAGVENNEFTKPQFRIKDYKSNAGDYSFGCVDNKGENKHVKMRTVGDMWGTGMFKCNACDFCDDVTTELADISLGDAWIPPYNQDGKGINVIVTRSELAEKIIKKGREDNQLVIDDINIEYFLKSQQSSFFHRHQALNFRIRKLKTSTKQLPPKRHDKGKIYLDFKLVQIQRMRVRKESLSSWANTLDIDNFEIMMKNKMSILNKLTYFYHVCRAFRKRVLKMNK